jgi:hypothetical protein
LFVKPLLPRAYLGITVPDFPNLFVMAAASASG